MEPQEEEKIIEKIASFVVAEGLEAAIIPILEFSRPFGWIGGQLGRFTVGPWLYLFGGSRFIKYFSFLEKKENLDNLVNKIEELSKNQKKEGGKRSRH